jgi:hypothetical protein
VVAGVNLRCRLIGETARRAFQIAADNGCDYFAILGDIFDNGKPSPEVIGVMADAIAASPIPVYVIPGNHDCSSDEVGNHALAALRKVKNCHVVDEPTLIGTVLFAPFSPRPPVEYFSGIIQRFPTTEYVLGHVGIIGDATPIFLTGGRNTISVEQIFEIKKHHPALRGWVAGDFHKHERFARGVNDGLDIIQAGALCQANFGDPLEVGRICVLDTDLGAINKILHVPGPRFVTLSFPELKAYVHGDGVSVLGLDTDECDLFLSVNCADEKEQGAAAAFLGAFENCGWKTEILPSAKAASEVVEAVRGAVQVEEALGEWAAAQPVSEAVKQRAAQIAEECLR